MELQYITFHLSLVTVKETIIYVYENISKHFEEHSEFPGYINLPWYEVKGAH